MALNNDVNTREFSVFAGTPRGHIFVLEGNIDPYLCRWLTFDCLGETSIDGYTLCWQFILWRTLHLPAKERGMHQVCVYAYACNTHLAVINAFQAKWHVYRTCHINERYGWRVLTELWLVPQAAPDTYDRVGLQVTQYSYMLINFVVMCKQTKKRTMILVWSINAQW